MNQSALKAVLAEYCKELCLSAVSIEYEGLCRQAQDDSWSYQLFLHELLTREVQKRRANTSERRVKEAGFPDLKTFEQMNWDVLQGVSKQKLMELSTCEYLKSGEDVVIIGPIGTGKTHLAIALGIEAAKRRKRVLFRRAAQLVRELVEARDDKALIRLHQKYQKIPLLVIDELGFVPFDRMEGELLFNLLAERYERCSTIVTSNLSFSEWVQVFGCEKLTTALLDRLAHHAHVLSTKGKSFRSTKGNKKHS
mgnify:CR=1 FL=1